MQRKRWRWSGSHSDKRAAAWLLLALLLLMCRNDDGQAYDEAIWTASWFDALDVDRGGVGKAGECIGDGYQLLWVGGSGDLVWLKVCQSGGTSGWPPPEAGAASGQQDKLIR
ncbi:hypothetical protein RF55_17803, partial [Lasius niger]